MTGTIQSESSNVSSELVQMYYDHQYDRIGKLEEQALTVTNVVTATSILALTFGFEGLEGESLTRVIALPFVTIAANLFAIGYIRNCQMFIALHQRRAMRTLELYAPALYDLNSALPWPQEDAWKGRRRFHILLHVAFCVAALIPIAVILASKGGE